MRIFIQFILLFVSLAAFPQHVDLGKIAKEIETEGKLLSRLETAAWYGSDIFTDSFQEPSKIGGYFSFLDGDKPKCLFFSKGENPKVIGVVSFGDIALIETATIDFKERDFKSAEKDLYAIRTKALTEIREDTVIKSYTNTNFNIIPVIHKGEKKVYILTGTKNTDVVLFGNDYLLTFDKQNNLLSKKPLHRNLIPIEFDDEKEVTGAMHSHSSGTSDFITPTDICTLMLYAKFAGWKQHFVMSENYVSIWDCEKESLTIVTKEEFESGTVR